ncbi:MAG: hypothetical protein JF570_05540 [Caulobacter sp.]|nr:hypothetical protein [Caulobacter sp.]
MAITLLTEADFEKIKALLPASASFIAGFPTKHGPDDTLERGKDCTTYIYTLDDHTIHKSTMCRKAEDAFEIEEDTVVGFW